MHAIIDPGHRISFPPLRNAALGDAIRRCLDRNPRTRITMQVGGAAGGVCVGGGPWGGREVVREGRVQTRGDKAAKQGRGGRLATAAPHADCCTWVP
jgi:hypothetical protein